MNAAPTRTWLLLVALTLLAMWAGGAAGGGSSLGLAGAAMVVFVSGLKAVAILRHFLELRRASGGWQAFFYGYLAVLAIGILAAYAAGGHVVSEALQHP